MIREYRNVSQRERYGWNRGFDPSLRKPSIQVEVGFLSDRRDLCHKDIMVQYVCEQLVRVMLTSLTVPMFMLNMSSYSNLTPALGWKIDALIVITVGARAATHISSMKILEDKFILPMPSIRNTFKNINIIAIQYAMSVLLHKRRLENHQPLPKIQDPP